MQRQAQNAVGYLSGGMLLYLSSHFEHINRFVDDVNVICEHATALLYQLTLSKCTFCEFYCIHVRQSTTGFPHVFVC